MQGTPISMPDHMRSVDAAAFLGVSVTTLYRWAREGHIAKGIKLAPRCTVWRRTDLEAFVDRQANEAFGTTDDVK